MCLSILLVPLLDSLLQRSTNPLPCLPATPTAQSSPRSIKTPPAPVLKLKSNSFNYGKCLKHTGGTSGLAERQGKQFLLWEHLQGSRGSHSSSPRASSPSQGRISSLKKYSYTQIQPSWILGSRFPSTSILLRPLIPWPFPCTHHHHSAEIKTSFPCHCFSPRRPNNRIPALVRCLIYATTEQVPAEQNHSLEL